MFQNVKICTLNVESVLEMTLINFLHKLVYYLFTALHSGAIGLLTQNVLVTVIAGIV